MERTALVTITDVTGDLSHGPGTHVAVSEAGEFLGLLLGGCVEAAVVGEALRVMWAGRAELLRLGSGSPVIDIRLPCGGGLDLLITPQPSDCAIAQALATLRSCRPVSLLLGLDGAVLASPGAAVTGWKGGRFISQHRPDFRLLVVGHGDETVALARLANAYQIVVEVLSPDPAGGAASSRAGAATQLLIDPAMVILA